MQSWCCKLDSKLCVLLCFSTILQRPAMPTTQYCVKEVLCMNCVTIDWNSMKFIRYICILLYMLKLTALAKSLPAM